MDFKIKPLDNQRPSGISTVPRHPFTSYIVASKGSGKTVLWLNLLIRKEFLKGIFNQVIIYSPTAKLDAKLDILKTTDGIISQNVKLLKLLGKLKKNEILSNPDISKLNKEESVTSLTNSDFKEEIDFEYLDEMIKEQKYVIENYGKTFADKILLVFDDSISSKTFATRHFQQIVFNSRHLNISMIIVSQSYYSLQKSIRNNNSHLILFETGNVKELKTIYEENNNGLTFNEFLELYNESISVPFGFLTINYQNDKKSRFQNQFLSIY